MTRNNSIFVITNNRIFLFLSESLSKMTKSDFQVITDNRGDIRKLFAKHKVKKCIVGHHDNKPFVMVDIDEYRDYMAFGHALTNLLHAKGNDFSIGITIMPRKGINRHLVPIPKDAINFEDLN